MPAAESQAAPAAGRLPNLQATRQARGMTRHELAIASGVGRSTIRRVEAEGAIVSARVGRRLAAALGTAPEDLEQATAALVGLPALRRLRLARGLSEPELAGRAGLGLALVLRLEEGAPAASAAIVARLAAALGAGETELVGRA